MRLRTRVAYLLAVAAVLGAADPFTGIWKLNLEKSVRRPGDQTKVRADASRTMTERGENLVLRLDQRLPGGSPFATVQEFPAKGGDVTFTEGYEPPDGWKIKATRPSSRVIEFTFYAAGGEPVRTERHTLTEDGKAMTVEVKGVGSDGSSRVDRATYWDRR